MMCLKGDFLNAARTWEETSASLCLWKAWRISSKSTSTFVSKRHTSKAFAFPRRRVDPSMNSVSVICPSPLSMNSNKLNKSWYSSSN
eukprot:Skav230099  [mRNA]  locus=scaffold283:85267:88310:+ [translate_table: standard]